MRRLGCWSEEWLGRDETVGERKEKEGSGMIAQWLSIMSNEWDSFVWIDTEIHWVDFFTVK